MPFPEKVNRVIYNKNPLDKVLCQLRFAPILKIDSEIPAIFQDKIRVEYPIYQEKIEYQNEIALGNMPQLPINAIHQSQYKKHIFISDDKQWEIHLNRTSIMLINHKYVKWETFSDKLKNIMIPFLSIYAPPFFTRTSLRYVDIFNRATLGLESKSWKDLLKPYFLGPLSDTISDCITNFQSTYEIRLEDGDSFVRLSSSFVKHIISGEECFMVDSDFYNPKKLDHSQIMGKLDFLHTRSSRLIRWIIKDDLHNAMEPVEI